VVVVVVVVVVAVDMGKGSGRGGRASVLAGRRCCGAWEGC